MSSEMAKFGGIYKAFERELGGIPGDPNIFEHHQVLELILQNSAARLKDRDGKTYRGKLADLAEAAGNQLSKMAEAERAHDMEGWATWGGKLSASFREIYLLSEDGLDDLGAEESFFNRVMKYVERLERLEKLKIDRQALLSEKAVEKLVGSFSDVLTANLSQEQARMVYAKFVEANRSLLE